MLGSTFVEMAIGLSLLYLMLSLLCSIAYEWVAKQSMLRARMLRKTIEELLGPAACKEFYVHALIQSLGTTEPSDFFRLPLVKSLLRIAAWWASWSFATAKKQDAAALDKEPTPAAPAAPAKDQGVWLEPSYIPSSLFATVVRQLKADYEPLKGALSNLRAGLSTPAEQDAAVAKWFDDVMARLSSRYKRTTQTWTLLVAVPLVLVLNADTLLIAHRLQRDKSLREAVVASAATFVKDHPELATSATPEPAASGASDPAAPPSRFFELSLQLEKLALPIGWPSKDEVKEAREAAKGAKTKYDAEAGREKTTQARAETALTDAEAKSMNASGKQSTSREKAKALRLKESAERAAAVKDPGEPKADAKEANAKREKELAKLESDDAKADADEARVEAEEARTRADKAVVDRDKARAEAGTAKLADEAARLENEDIELRAWAPWSSLPGTQCSRRIMGWLLTALALSLGASFWFDTLGKLFSIRGAGEKPEKASK